MCTGEPTSAPAPGSLRRSVSFNKETATAAHGDGDSEGCPTPGSDASRLSSSGRRTGRGLWLFASSQVRVHPTSGDSPDHRRKKIAKRFSRGFVAPSSLAEQSFQRVRSVGSAQRGDPTNFSEFYSQLSARAGEAPHAFIHSEVDPLGFRDEAERLRYRLYKANRFLINPNTRQMQYWDILMLGLLLYTATVTPYEVCMMWDTKLFGSPLYVINWIVNALFIVDMVMNFFIPYRESYRKGSHVVKNHWLIAKHYLRTWFVIDLISNMYPMHVHTRAPLMCMACALDVYRFVIDLVSVLPIDTILTLAVADEAPAQSPPAPRRAKIRPRAVYARPAAHAAHAAHALRARRRPSRATSTCSMRCACCGCCGCSSSSASCAPRASSRAGRAASASRTPTASSSSGSPSW